LEEIVIIARIDVAFNINQAFRSPFPSPSGYDRGMDDNRPTLSSAILAVTVHVFVMPVLFWSGIIIWVVAPSFFAVPAGIVFIWLVVRWSNHRDDPRFAKRPPDAP
jgi:Flp pilus assembly protein TadB